MDDRERFLALFLRHQHEVRAFVASVVRDWHVAEDVVQEVGLVLWRKFDTYDPRRPFGAWARGVAAVQVLKERDRIRRALPILSPEGVEAVRRAYDETERREPVTAPDALRRCLQGLPGRARDLLRLRYEESLPLERVAAALAASLPAVKKALLRIRARLHGCVRQRLASAGGPPA
jgi:RNA polymerase sigma-70 factor (ECF subfamily)